jgi:hypothetical protein
VPEPDRLGAADTAAVAWASEMPPERSEAETKPLPPSHRTEIGGGGRGRRRDAQRWTAFGGAAAAGVTGKRRNAGGGAEEKKEPGMNMPIPRGINRLSRKDASLKGEWHGILKYFLS